MRCRVVTGRGTPLHRSRDPDIPWSAARPEGVIGQRHGHHRWTIGRGFLKVPRGVALDPATKNMIVSDKIGNRLVTFSLPEVF